MTAAELTTRLRDLGLTQTAFAARIGYTREHINRLASGTHGDIPLVMAELLRAWAR